MGGRREDWGVGEKKEGKDVLGFVGIEFGEMDGCRGGFDGLQYLRGKSTSSSATSRERRGGKEEKRTIPGIQESP